MFILGKVPIVNKYTDKTEGHTLSMIEIDLMAIRNIDENIETGNAIIHYKTGVKELETSIPFTTLFSYLYNSGIIDTSLLPTLRGVSDNFDKFIYKNHEL